MPITLMKKDFTDREPLRQRQRYIDGDRRKIGRIAPNDAEKEIGRIAANDDERRKKRRIILSVAADLRENLSDKRFDHTERVRETASKLADRYGEDIEKAELASLFHDMYREISEDELEALIDEYHLDKCRYSGNIELAHGKIAAAAMRVKYGIEDADTINAVSFHTTGRAGMSPLEKIIFIADATEPSRNYPGAETLRETLKKDLNRACMLALKNTIKFLNEKKIHVDRDTLEAEKYFTELLRENG